MEAVKKEPAGNGRRGKRPNPVGGCPLTAALAAVGGKWKLIIVYWLAESPKHFAGLRQEMSSISPKVLTQQLRELVEALASHILIKMESSLQKGAIE